jgi:hypothetical protein
MIPDMYDYYKCENCGSYFGCLDPDVSERQRRKILLECQRNNDISSPTMHVKSKISSSKSSKKRGKKQQMKKPSTTELYNRLATEKNTIKLKKNT